MRWPCYVRSPTPSEITKSGWSAGLDSPVSFANSRLAQAVAGLRTGVVLDCAIGPPTSQLGAQMPSTRGFAARRRGVRDSRLPPVHNDARTDVSVQHNEAFTPASSHAGYTIDIGRQGPTRVMVWAASGGRGGSRRAAEGRLPEGGR
jgi:hypothetical protein